MQRLESVSNIGLQLLCHDFYCCSLYRNPFIVVPPSFAITLESTLCWAWFRLWENFCDEKPKWLYVQTQSQASMMWLAGSWLKSLRKCLRAAQLSSQALYQNVWLWKRLVKKVAVWTFSTSMSELLITFQMSLYDKFCLSWFRDLVDTMLQYGVDLIVIEGMGRSLHTNLNSKFKCESLKLAVIKVREILLGNNNFLFVSIPF